ncbi:thermonuclease family protein [Psychrobacter sp. T6-5]|uniref:thermonuclease family protein n=1 Tax=Psychrobacter sp. T6-5 TaxID=3457451 RepID=UPI003FD20B84
MRYVAVVGLVLALVGCGGGYDDIDAKRDATTGSTDVIVGSSGSNNDSADKCFEPNILNVSSVRVIDGDTVEVTPLSGQSERVRLLGIDAPESAQEYGIESTTALSQCVSNAIVTIEWIERDRYDRLLGKVIANNVDCNLNQLQEGAAWHYKEYQSSQTPYDRIEYSNAEIVARSNGRGLWANRYPIKPSDYRSGKNSSDLNFNNDRLPSKGASKCYSKPSAGTSNGSGIIIPLPPAGAICSNFIKKTCGQITTCVEAQQQLACGNTQIDGDQDGVPCESICPGG